MEKSRIGTGSRLVTGVWVGAAWASTVLSIGLFSEYGKAGGQKRDQPVSPAKEAESE